MMNMTPLPLTCRKCGQQINVDPSYSYTGILGGENEGTYHNHCAPAGAEGRDRSMSKWKLVPVEPTDAMINAAEAAHANSEFARQTDGQVYGSIYRAMLAAATAEAGNAIEDRNVWKRVVPPEEVGAEPDAERVLSRAAQDVLAERRRQISAEGWTPEHDDQHDDEALAHAAACYAAGNKLLHWHDGGDVWPWRWEWKPKDDRRNLVRAAALLLAEIERRDRLTPGEKA
jgi:hypothetical protein